MDVAAYLERLRYSGPLSPNSETLRNLHRAHLLIVPFENLDISLGRKIVLDEDAFVRKLVSERRGGFCYELNGAFSALLRTLGFRVTLLSARVPREDGSMTPEFDHLTLRVDLDDPWLADVGFGDSFVEPLLLKPNLEQEQGGRKFRIIENRGRLDVQRAESDGVWKLQYAFKLRPRQLQEFAKMCHYHQTSPRSPFTRKKLCTMATPNGRITLSEMKLIVTSNGKKDERMLESEAEWETVLRERFGVSLSKAEQVS